MLDFFIATFGSLYYGGKFLNDKVNKDKSDIRWSNYKHTESIITNTDLQYEIRGKMKNYDFRKSILDEIPISVKEYVFGDNWKDLFLNRKIYIENDATTAVCYHFIDIWDIIFQIYFSTKGYIGIYNTKYNIWFPVRGAENSTIQPKVARNACKIIEQNMQKCHPELGLRLCKDTTNPKLLAWKHWLQCCNSKLDLSSW